MTDWITTLNSVACTWTCWWRKKHNFFAVVWGLTLVCMFQLFLSFGIVVIAVVVIATAAHKCCNRVNCMTMMVWRIGCYHNIIWWLALCLRVCVRLCVDDMSRKHHTKTASNSNSNINNNNKNFNAGHVTQCLKMTWKTFYFYFHF